MNDKQVDSKIAPEVDKPPNTTGIEDEASFYKLLESIKWTSRLKAKLRPNFSYDWVKSLKARLPV